MSLHVADRVVTNRQRQTLSERVRHFRALSKMSQQELATAAALSVSLISSIEQGRIKDPRLSTLKAIAAALGVALSDILPD
jgi:transcriptional regulator with XRE-family HTH domain